jgi:uncharacterized protein YpmB
MVKKRKCSTRSLILICLSICVLVSFSLIVYLSYANHSNAKSDDDDIAEYSKYFSTSNNANIIHLEVYYEALCPDSQTFLKSQLEKLLGNNRNKGIFQERVKIDLIPFGKANVIYFYIKIFLYSRIISRRDLSLSCVL